MSNPATHHDHGENSESDYRNTLAFRDELTASLERAARLSVTPTAFLMMLTYAVLAVAHLFVLPAPASFVMAATAGLTSIICGVVWHMHKMGKRANSNGHHLLGLLAFLILIDVSIHMAINEDYLQTTHIALVIVGCGFMMLHRIWFAVSIAAFIGVWIFLTQILPPSREISHYTYLMATSSSIAVAAHIARYRTTVQAESARILSEHDREAMEHKVRAQQDHLEHVSRLNTMGELVAEISHELNQPLTAISNLAIAERVQLEQNESTVKKQSVVETLKQISDTAVFAASIIKRIRGYVDQTNHIESDVDLNQVIRDAAELLFPYIANHRIELELDLDQRLPSVGADEVQMQQVVVNLLQNAFDALEDQDQGHVTINTTQHEDKVVIRVTDDGPGIQTENGRSVFDPFFTTKEFGMGMGLAICRSIVESHGGNIDCRFGDGPNQSGTTVEFSIPFLPTATVFLDSCNNGSSVSFDHPV